LNKLSDSVVTDFRVKLKNPNAQKIIDDFIHDTNLHTILNAWVKEGFGKGNGFIEIDLKESKVRIMNANGMYIKRNNKGKVLEYTQWVKSYNRFTKDSKDLITFKPNQIAHLTINKIPNDPYGIGIVWSNERIIENLINNEQDLQKLTTRKAGQPYHIKVGQPGSITPQSVVDNVNQALQYLTTRTEWVTDADVEIKVIDFPNLGKNITETQMYFYRMLLAGVEMPEVLMGSGQLNEGIGTVQLQGYKRKISSRQTYIASIIEEKIIRPLLRANNLDEQPEFVWELPTEEDIDKRLAIIAEDLKNPLLSPMMRAALEIEKAKLMGFEELADSLPSPEDAQTQSEIDKQNQLDIQKGVMSVEPEVPTPKQPTSQSTEREREENIPLPMVPGVLNQGWVTGDDGRHYYIDDEGNSHSGKDAINTAKKDTYNRERGERIKNYIQKDLPEEHTSKINIKVVDEIKDKGGNVVPDALGVHRGNGKIEIIEGVPKEVIYHEIGHSVHNSLDSGKKTEWERVSIYVEPTNEISRFDTREDFAESYSEFASKGKISYTSGKIESIRTEFMKKIFKK
ncbi:MAG: hypothetical protein AABY22_36845, partial [Nanoarchaeota archaeon]